MTVIESRKCVYCGEVFSGSPKSKTCKSSHRQGMYRLRKKLNNCMYRNLFETLPETLTNQQREALADLSAKKELPGIGN